MKLTVLIPAFNEEDSLASVIRTIPQAISGIIIWIVGLVADMLDRIRSNQEKILYLLKRQNYDRRAYSGNGDARDRKAAGH